MRRLIRGLRVCIGRSQAGLAIADITLWELPLLQERGRLQLPADVAPAFYLKQLLAALRPLVVEGGSWRLAAISPEEAPLALDPEDLESSGLFGVGVAVVHHLRRRRAIRVQKP